MDIEDKISKVDLISPMMESTLQKCLSIMLTQHLCSLNQVLFKKDGSEISMEQRNNIKLITSIMLSNLE